MASSGLPSPDVYLAPNFEPSSLKVRLPLWLVYARANVSHVCDLGRTTSVGTDWSHVRVGSIADMEQCRGLLYAHQVQVPSTAKKADLVQLFEDNVRPRAQVSSHGVLRMLQKNTDLLGLVVARSEAIERCFQRKAFRRRHYRDRP
jgi:hypothetical protein